MANNTIPPYDIDTYLLQVSRGLIDDAEPLSIYGSTDSGGAVVAGLIFPDTNYTFSYPNQATGESVSFVSTSDEDGAGTETGILTMHVHYLDVNLEEQEATITLNGTTDVTGQLTGVRFIQCMHLSTAGSAKKAVGDIYAYRASAITPEDEVFSIISAGSTRCSSSMRMVPTGKALYIRGTAASSVSTTADAHALVEIFATEYGHQEFHDEFIRIPIGAIGLQNGSTSYIFSPPVKVAAGGLIGAQYWANKACTVSISMFGWFENESKPSGA
jgi:hypothetical protein